MHYYQFNIADYRKDAGHLTMVEHGIYRSLIDWYYLDESPIPLETQVVMRRLRLGLEESENLANVLRDFFIRTEKGYYHKRIHEELERYQTQFAKNRVNGKAGGRPKKQVVTDEKTQVVSANNHMVTQTEPKITLTNNQEPITKNQEPVLKDVSPKGDMSTPGGDRRPPVPHEKIIELYHEALPAAPRVMSKLWNGTRKKHLQARWNEDKSRQTTDWWRKFFLWASYSSFLTGNVKPSSGRDAPFMADLGWIICPSNFVKVYEGKYHDLSEKAQYHREHGGAK